jgi:hypothetical protein
VHPLFGFRFPPESCPTQPSPPAVAVGLLSWASGPYSTLRLGDPLVAGAANAHYGPPSGFGYPLGGLRPPSPCRFCFTPAALLGFTLRSFLLSEGIRHVSGRKNPRTVSPVGDPAAEAMGRPNGPRFLGFHPSESPWRPNAVLVRRPLVAPLGFALLGHSGEDLAQDFAQAPPTRFATPALRPAPAGASESQSVSAWSRPERPASRTTDEATLLGSSHQNAPGHSSGASPGLWVHLMPRRALLPTGRQSWGEQPRSTGAARETCRWVLPVA